MFCGKCGTKINDEMKFCPNCGYGLEKIDDVQKHESTHTNHNVYSNNIGSENEKPKSKLGKILLWIFLFPLMLMYSIITSKKLTKMMKIGILFVWVIIALIASANNANAQGNAGTNNNPTSTSITAPTLSEYDKKVQDNITQDLISRGIEESTAVKAYDIIKEIELPKWESKESIQVEDASKDDYIFSYPATDGMFSTVYAFHVLKGEIVEIVDDKQEVVYNTKGLNKEYLFYGDVEWSTLVNYSKTVVDSVLKAPTTAKYPGSFLSPYEGWSFGKNGNIVTIKSYVDSQNSFGAMIRSSFSLKIRYAGADSEAIYFEFDGKVLVNKK